MTMEAPPHSHMIMAVDYNVSFDRNMTEGTTIGLSIPEREAHYAGRPMVLQTLRQRLRLKTMNTFNSSAEPTRWPRTPREQPEMIDDVPILEDHDHKVSFESRKMEFMNTVHSLLRMKMAPRHTDRNERILEEPDEFITEASDTEYTTYFAARPGYVATDADPRKLEQIMKENIKLEEAEGIDAKVEQWRESCWT